MKKSTIYFSAAFILLTVFSSGCAILWKGGGQGGYTLAYQFEKGQKMNIKTVSLSAIESDQQGQVISVDVNSEIETVYRITGVNPEGNFIFETENTKMTQTAKSPMGDNATDFSPWIGKKLQFTLSPNGKASDFQGYDDLPVIVTATGEQATGTQAKEGVKRIFFSLPDHPVKVGDSWKDSTSTDFPFNGSTLHIKESTTYKIADQLTVDGFKCLKLEVAGLQNMSGDFEQNGMALSLTRETKTSGTILFAYEKGMYLSLDTESTAEGMVDVTAMGISIPQHIKSKSSVKVSFD